MAKISEDSSQLMSETGIWDVLERLGVEVCDAEAGFIRCPGEHRHTTSTRVNDCKLFINTEGVPWRVHCFHSSCDQEVATINKMLARLARLAGVNGRATGEGKRTESQKDNSEQLELKQAAKEAKDGILQEYAWPYAAIQTDSPVRIDDDCPEHVLLLDLFQDEDVIWIGRDVRDSGKPNHQYRFRPVLHWMGHSDCPGQFICPSTFKPGVWSRSRSNVMHRRFLVVESDVLNRDQVGSIFRWLTVEAALKLRAVVDTAGKSLHGWFESPPPEKLAQLAVILPALGCDKAMFEPSQPCRLPGAMRDGRKQKLIYLS